MITLHSLQIENLRGFSQTSFPLDQTKTVLVGPNNSGKTSILKLLDWFFNADIIPLLKDHRPITGAEKSLLLPARTTVHRARRMTLRIHESDGRKRRKISCDKDGFADVRINIRLTPTERVYAAAGKPRKGESAITHQITLDLIGEMRDAIGFTFIPAFRDANSASFQNTFQGTLRNRLSELSHHNIQGGAPQGYRKVSKAKDEIEKRILESTSPLWTEVSGQLPSGMAKTGALNLAVPQEELINFFADRLAMQVSTGSHDESTVPLSELGSGLQSQLELAFQNAGNSTNASNIIAIEEPESFLHPTAQRNVAREILGNPHKGTKLLITTHSPIIVEEAQYSELLLSRDRKFYYPTNSEDAKRNAINSALLAGHGAEMAFSSSVLFVEGEGDRQFYEQLRRRIAKFDPTGLLDHCFVVPVGGKTFFAPWIRLVESFKNGNESPIKWLALVDADGSREIREGFLESQYALPTALLGALGQVTAAYTAFSGAYSVAALSLLRSEVQSCNKVAENNNIPIHISNIEIEDDALANVSDDFIDNLLSVTDITGERSLENLLKKLGAKAHNGGATKKPHKAPWIRGYIGQSLAASSVSTGVMNCLKRWITNVHPPKETSKILKNWVDQETSN